MYTENQKRWMTFLCFIYYKTEKRMEWFLSKNHLNALSNLIKVWDELGPKIIASWGDGDLYDGCDNQKYFALDYSNPWPNSFFEKAFGKDLLNKYSSHVVLGFSKTFIEMMYDLDDNIEPINLRLCFHDDDKLTLLQDGYLVAWYSMTKINGCVAHRKESFVKKCQTQFDQDFFDFFVEHIGIEFEKAENFFEIYLPSKLNAVKV